jgi:glycogen operon protein
MLPGKLSTTLQIVHAITHYLHGLRFVIYSCVNNVPGNKHQTVETIVYPGNDYPLGATWKGNGVNFALYSENATKVEVCLFHEPGDATAYQQITLPEKNHNIFHGFVPGLGPGQLYGYRVHGPYDPKKGHRFNPNKLLVDPNAREIAGKLQWNNAIYGYDKEHKKKDSSFSYTDSAAFVPKSVVIDPYFNWENDAPLHRSYHEQIIYELHVKGFTCMHTGLPENIRGTYAALCHPLMLQYFKDMGITSVELMPVHFFVDSEDLLEKGLSNYWGYNSIGFFAPHTAYASTTAPGSVVNEFKNMVKQLHKAGIEVILDVVYNHTGEGDHTGPTLSLRGIDNAAYYRLQETKKKHYNDYTGTGNTLDASRIGVLKLVMDSLRYWITEMHVDGFRFDLAASLARDLQEVNMLGCFFNIICQDPVISQAKLIAEPWDIGENGYQVGNFPTRWAEWNDKYRDCMRSFWRGENKSPEEFAQRFCGSADLYQNNNRTPSASINLITAHDGFTLHDLVSYNRQHNENNKIEGKDGIENNRSINWGTEGHTIDEKIVHNRNRHKRNLLATLFFSQGVPMLFAGDESGNTQFGNNNAYSQDNEISWVNWAKADTELRKFVSQLIALRKAHPVFRHSRWFMEEPVNGNGLKDISWFLPDGTEMKLKHWESEKIQAFAVFLNGSDLHFTDDKGIPVTDDSFLIVFNNTQQAVGYRFPPPSHALQWKKVLDTSDTVQTSFRYRQDDVLTVNEFCVMLFQKV